VGLDKSNLRPGSRRYDITGPLAFVREPPTEAIREIDGRRGSELCGKRLDWVELP
jgi:hypothetical protein